MFEPVNCFKGALLAGAIAGVWLHSLKAALVFAAIPAFFGIIGLLGG